jgi:anti-sigma factor RsiW
MSKHTSTNTKQSEAKRHEEVWQLLPWYVNGTLDDPERDIAAQHISICQTCEGEIARCRTIASALHSSDVAAWTPSPAHFIRLMTHIDRESTLTTVERWRLRIREWVDKSRRAFLETSSPLRWTLAVQSAVMVLLAAVIILQGSIAPPVPYLTLSDVGTGPELARAHIRVVFADDIMEREIRALLSSVDGAIVAGPSQMAVYTVVILGSGEERPARTRAALETLRAHSKVRLAELKEP